MANNFVLLIIRKVVYRIVCLTLKYVPILFHLEAYVLADS